MKKEENIIKTGKDAYGAIYVRLEDGIGFVSDMKEFCEEGPFKFKRYRRSKNYFEGIGYVWHRSWLTKVSNKQYLLEFE